MSAMPAEPTEDLEIKVTYRLTPSGQAAGPPDGRRHPGAAVTPNSSQAEDQLGAALVQAGLGGRVLASRTKNLDAGGDVSTHQTVVG